MLQTPQPDEERVADLLRALGRAYLENGEHQKAAHKFGQLYQLGYRDPHTLAQYALAVARCERVDPTALQLYKEVAAAVRDHETLYVTLAKLFLKAEYYEEPALAVYRQALAYAPPFSEEIRQAIERIFQDTTDTVTLPELKQTLLQSLDNPDLLNLYLNTVWSEGRFDEALHILRDLYLRSHRNPLYLRALFETLLEKKAYAETHGLRFHLSSIEARYCLKYRRHDAPLARIRDLEEYLDFKNLLTAFVTKPPALSAADDEFEIFILDQAMENLDALEEIQRQPVSIDPSFDLTRDLVSRFDDGTRASYVNSFDPQHDWLNQVHALALLEIANFDIASKASKLPFATFLKLVTNDLASAQPVVVCKAQDGLLLISADPAEMAKALSDTMHRLVRYNQVAETSEIIHPRATLHATPVPLAQLEQHGLKELRKLVKIHNLKASHAQASEVGAPQSGYRIRLSEGAVGHIHARGLTRLGDFLLPRFAGDHTVFEFRLDAEGATAGVNRPTRFGKYEVQKPLREQATVTTYLGYDPQLDRNVVIKAYRPEAFSAYKNGEELRKQFFEQIRKLNRINHGQVAVIYDAGEQDGLLYLVREFVEGTALNDRLHGEKVPDIAETLKYYVQLCRPLEHFHAQQVWHRNLKPDNVFLTPPGEIKLTDAGILQFRPLPKGAAHPEPQTYAAPEQIQGMKLTAACDVFQFGLLLYESLTTLHPFRAQDAHQMRIRILAEEPEPPTKLRFDLSPKLEAVILGCLVKNPAKRLSSVAVLRESLQKLAGSGRPLARRAPNAEFK